MAAAPPQTLVSYAQNREDLYLWALVGDRTPGTYVDVGCYDERLHSVTRLFYEHGWSGLNIDANDGFRPGYARRERDRFICAGIGREPGELKFRVYPNHDGLSTFDAGIMEQHVGSGYGHRDIVVPVRTLDDVLAEENVRQIDFLKIDVEGFEPDVLLGLDLEVVRPAVIVIEANRTAECEAILFPSRYHREFFDGLNYYYVDDDAVAVTIFNYAPRVLHAGYLTAREQTALAEIESLKAARSDPDNVGVQTLTARSVAQLRVLWGRARRRLHTTGQAFIDRRRTQGGATSSR